MPIFKTKVFLLKKLIDEFYPISYFWLENWSHWYLGVLLKGVCRLHSLCVCYLVVFSTLVVLLTFYIFLHIFLSSTWNTGMIFHVTNWKIKTKLWKTINKLSSISGFRINLYKSVALIYSTNKHKEREIIYRLLFKIVFLTLSVHSGRHSFPSHKPCLPENQIGQPP